MWQAEALIDLDAVAQNVTYLRGLSAADIMAVVKADGYGHGAVPVARAALAGGATWLGVTSLDEAYALRDAGIREPVLAWSVSPGTPTADAVRREIDLSVGGTTQLSEVVAGAREAGRPARVHLRVDLDDVGARRGSPGGPDPAVADGSPDGWSDLVVAAAKAQADGTVDIVGAWGDLDCGATPGHPDVDRRLAAFRDALTGAERAGLRPRLRHVASSAGLLTRPDTHFDLVRAGIGCYGYSPVAEPSTRAGLRPAMTLRARVLLVKRVSAGQGVSYGLTYTTSRPATLAVVPVGYADGVPRGASGIGPLLLGGARRTVAGRVCMDQFVVDVGDDPVAEGDMAVLFGPGSQGEPTADDWASVLSTTSYEIVSRIGPRVRRRHVGAAAVPTAGVAG
ncbi:MAG: alanine racemase [Actinocatenispora sp.]